MEKEEKLKKPEEPSFYDIRISDIRHAAMDLALLLPQLKESIDQFNKESSKYSKRLYYLTIIMAILAVIQVCLLLFS